MYSRSSAAWPAPETTFARLCSRVMSCGVGCTKTRTFTTVLHLYKTKSTKSFTLSSFLVSNAIQTQTSEYLGFLPLLLQYCSWQSFVKQFQNAVYNLQTFKNLSCIYLREKDPESWASYIQYSPWVYTFLFCTGAARFPFLWSCGMLPALPQTCGEYRTHQDTKDSFPTTQKMQIFCSEEFSCPAVRYLTPGDACIQ